MECVAELEPRSRIALPDFRHRAAASIVTFGRASYTTATTPSGTRTLRICRPLAKREPSITSPTGSGSATISRTPRAIAAIRPRVEREAVQQRGREAGLAAGLEVARVGLEDLGRACLERVGDREQRAVLGGRVEHGQFARGGLRGAAEIGDGLGRYGHRPRIGERSPYASTK